MSGLPFSPCFLLEFPVPTFAIDQIRQFAIDLLDAGGTTSEEAELVGDSLIGANLRGYAFYPRVRNGSIGVVQTNGEELLPILPTIGFRWEF